MGVIGREVYARLEPISMSRGTAGIMGLMSIGLEKIVLSPELVMFPLPIY
jgi:hypothetical protein